MNHFTRHLLPSVSNRHSVEVVDLELLSAAEIASWSMLADRAIAPNPFVVPEFVLPMVESLGTKQAAVMIVRDEYEQWQFAVPVVQRYFEEGSPLRKLRVLSSPYTFLEHPLVDRVDPALTLTCLFDALAQQREWHGFGCAKSVVNSDQFELMEFAAKVCGLEFHVTSKFSRPAVTPQPRENLMEKCSSSRRKSLRKTWKRLEGLGNVEFRINQFDGESLDPINAFLHLESLGWKGSEGTALTCDSNHHQFFLSMCRRFAENQNLYFGELLLDGDVISSTCNIRSGNTLFAFKIGWNPEYSECGLGYWSEILLADAIFHHDSSITMIDSCSDEDSYTGKVWTERIELSNALLIWSRRARLVQGAKTMVKTIVQ